MSEPVDEVEDEVEGLPSLARRRQRALDGLAASAAKADGVAVQLGKASRRGAVHDNLIRLGAVETSLGKLRELTDAAAANIKLPEVKVPTPEPYLVERIAIREQTAQLDREATEAAESRLLEHEETVAREVAMVEALDAIRTVLTSQEEHTSYNDRLQRAIFAVTVLGFIGAIVFGVATIAGAWWVAVLGGCVGLALSALVLWWAGLLAMPRMRSPRT